jgi:hypothetical protein
MILKSKKYLAVFLFGITSAFCAFNVKDYGAIGDGITDDTAAILTTISTANAASSSNEVYFPAGIYKISSSNEYALQLENLSNIRLKGEGTNSILLVSNPENGGIGFTYCTNISVEGFTFDYDPLPFTQGTITDVDTISGTFDLLIDAGYPELSNPAFSIAESKWGLKVDLAKNNYNVWAYFSSTWTNIAAQTWRLFADDPSYLQAHPLSVGDRYAHMARRWTAFDIGCNFCTNIEIRNITIYAAAGLTVGIINSDGNILVRELNVGLKLGSTRLLATNGDGVHSAGCSAGLIIENCSFEGMPDDGINIHGRGGVIISNITDTVKRVGTPRTAFFAAGDEIQFLNNTVGGIRGNAVVLSATQINNVVWEISFDQPMPDLTANWYTGDKISNLSRCGQNSVIRNNYFGSHRGRDILLRSRDIIISNNYFYNSSLAEDAVSLDNGYRYYAEGPPSYNINIIGNIFEGGTNHWSWSVPTIAIHSYLSDGVNSPTYDSSNVVIKANLFINIDGTTIEASSVSGVEITDNTVDTELGIKVAESPVILLNYADKIQINNLNIQDLNTATYAGVHIKNSVPAALGSVIIIDLVTDMATGSVDVLDDRGKAVTLYTSDDSMAVGANTNGNYGSSTFMRIRHQSSADWGNYFPLVKFDLSALPKNIIVNEARMRFYVGLSDDSGSGWPVADNFPAVAIYENLQNWDETTVTFANKPECFTNPVDSLNYFGLIGIDEIYFTGTNLISSGGWLEFTGEGTKNLVQKWANGTVSNYGITIKGLGDYTDSSRYFDLQTKENSSAAVHPVIIIDFTAVPEPVSFYFTGFLFAIFFKYLTSTRSEILSIN